jgi:hypothetical protein
MTWMFEEVHIYRRIGGICAPLNKDIVEIMALVPEINFVIGN